mmetsp:Transcript_151974/g.369051  ORF Transcript_151974/g.369051 Transcript_151974/m.369051 type:complete len:225 (-) Transcript_151974:45-719(-)
MTEYSRPSLSVLREHAQRPWSKSWNLGSGRRSPAAVRSRGALVAGHGLKLEGACPLVVVPEGGFRGRAGDLLSEICVATKIPVELRPHAFGQRDAAGIAVSVPLQAPASVCTGERIDTLAAVDHIAGLPASAAVPVRSSLLARLEDRDVTRDVTLLGLARLQGIILRGVAQMLRQVVVHLLCLCIVHVVMLQQRPYGSDGAHVFVRGGLRPLLWDSIHVGEAWR